MNIFLRAKHWQLFVFNFALPFFLYLILVAVMISQVAGHRHPDPWFFFRFIPGFLIVGVISAFVQYAWTWAAAINLMEKVPEELRPDKTFFMVSFFIPIVYFFLFGIVMLFMFRIAEFSPWILLPIFPIHIFVIFCSFYCMYFTAKVIKTAEEKRVVPFIDHVLEIVLIWFYPIGIWFLQPRINKLVEEEEKSET